MQKSPQLVTVALAVLRDLVRPPDGMIAIEVDNGQPVVAPTGGKATALRLRLSTFATSRASTGRAVAAIFTLADKHGASKQATAWRFVEEQDEAVALLQYYPNNAIDEARDRVLVVWRSVGSPEFNKRLPQLTSRKRSVPAIRGLPRVT